jgi:hypothetical protein
VKKNLSHNKQEGLISTLDDLLGEVEGMIYKEEHILFPMSLDVLSEEDWRSMRQGEDAIGYAWLDPQSITKTV